MKRRLGKHLGELLKAILLIALILGVLVSLGGPKSGFKTFIGAVCFLALALALVVKSRKDSEEHRTED